MKAKMMWGVGVSKKSKSGKNGAKHKIRKNAPKPLKFIRNFEGIGVQSIGDGAVVMNIDFCDAGRGTLIRTKSEAFRHKIVFSSLEDFEDFAGSFCDVLYELADKKVINIVNVD